MVFILMFNIIHFSNEVIIAEKTHIMAIIILIIGNPNEHGIVEKGLIIDI